MFATHILPLHDEDDVPTLTGLLADGRASALFAVLAGVGVALGTGGPRRPPGARAHLGAAVALLVRGALVGLLGLGWSGLTLGRGDPALLRAAVHGGRPLLRLPAAVLAGGAVLSARWPRC